MTTNEDYFKDELTLKDILHTVVRYSKALWSGKWWVLLGVLAMSLTCGYFEYQKAVMYTGDLTFMVNEDKTGGSSGLSSILGQVGLGGGASGEHNLEKIVELSKSQLIVHDVLLDSVIIGAKTDRLINHIIDVYSYREEWTADEKTDWANVTFNSDSVGNYDRVQRKVLKNIYGKVIGNKEESGLISIDFNPVTTILRIRGLTLNEELTETIIEKIFDRLSNFYVQKSTANAQKTLEQLNWKVDSIRNVLSSAEYALARNRDEGRSIIQYKDQVNTLKNSREVQILSIMYAEAIKNQATAEFTLNSSRPFLAVIDRPFAPLGAVRPQVTKQAIIGGVVGGLIISIIILMVAFIKDVLS